MRRLHHKPRIEHGTCMFCSSLTVTFCICPKCAREIHYCIENGKIKRIDTPTGLFNQDTSALGRYVMKLAQERDYVSDL